MRRPHRTIHTVDGILHAFRELSILGQYVYAAIIRQSRQPFRIVLREFTRDDVQPPPTLRHVAGQLLPASCTDCRVGREMIADQQQARVRRQMRCPVLQNDSHD